MKEALRRIDEKSAPGRPGERVALVGVLTSDPFALSKSASSVTLQDETGGIHLFTRDTTLLVGRFKRGDLVQVRGVLVNYKGMPELQVEEIQRLGTREVPAPRDVLTADLKSKRYSGQLVRVVGQLIVPPDFQETRSFLLRDRSGEVPVFVPSRFLQNPRFGERLMEGGSAEIIGIASQSKDEPPYDTGYRLLPRDPADFHFVPVPPYRAIAFAAGLALFLAVIAYLWVRRRHAERRAREIALLSEGLKRSEEALRKAHDELEARVWERTAELAQAYEALKADVIERERLEEQLRQAQKMEAVGQLAGGVAHDFNNLLGVIIGYADILQETQPLADSQRHKLREIRKAGESAAVLTRQLLAFSRRQVLEPRVLEINAVVAETEKMLRRLIGEDIELVIQLSPDVGRVRTDLVQLQQVILNLAVNARDAMPRGGRLTLQTANAELDDAYAKQRPPVSPGLYVVLTVSDTGVGMDQTTQTHIFEPFFTTKEKGKGTGLGLATVYGIVKQSSGYIWVYSEPGRGATFKVYLPRVHDPAEAAMAGKAPSQSLRGSETILLVEDAQTLQELVRDILESGGYTVLLAASSAQALEIAQQHKGRIGLLLTDVVMPGMSGRELSEQILTHRPGIKIVYMSGYTDDAIVRHGLLQAGVAFLEKPFTRDKLMGKVRQVFDEPQLPNLSSTPAHEKREAPPPNSDLSHAQGAPSPQATPGDVLLPSSARVSSS